jgi:hypothetical protein
MNTNTQFVIAACYAIVSFACSARGQIADLEDSGTDTNVDVPAEAVFKIVKHSNGPVIESGDPGTLDNKYGFEGGRVLKMNENYYLFTTEMVGNPLWTYTRLALWRSCDKDSWERLSTLFESSGNFTGEDPRAALWSPMPTYDHQSARWMLSYVAYNSKPNSEKGWFRNFNGKIWLAISTKTGFEGIEGPYRDSLVILQPGNDSDSWEGLMGTDSFFPFSAGDGWMAFYGSSPESVGLARSNHLAGSWKRETAFNPVRRFIENPVVSRLTDGRYVALFDGCGNNRKIGYMISEDGFHWSCEKFFELAEEMTPWWGLTRTPLGLVQESEDLFTIFFTAYNRDFYTIPEVWQTNDDGVFEGYFASIGWFQVRLIR